MRIQFSRGPAVLITAAFIGPGTLTMCITAGVQHDFSLLWAMLLSILITIFVQNTAAQISWTTRRGLARSMLMHTSSRTMKVLLSTLLIMAIFLGNAAYEAGNLSGAVIGIKGIVPGDILFFDGIDFLPFLFGGLVALFLLRGTFRGLQHMLMAIVILMSASFIITAIITRPNLDSIISGLFLPHFATADALTILGLLGTTVVPYNLFLHAAMVAQSPNLSLAEIKNDTYVAVGLGGVISLCIIISAAALEGTNIAGPHDLAKALAPMYGRFAPLLMSFGYFAAGLTSAITAPMAAAFVVSECFQFSSHSRAYKGIAILVLSTGIYFTTLDIIPLEIIRMAQIANGILLPVLGVILLWMINNAKLMRGKTASLFTTTGVVFVLFFFIFLGIKSLGFLLE